MLTTRRQFAKTSVAAAALLASPKLRAAERRVIGLASDGKTAIEILVREGYTGLGGTVLIGGLQGEDASSKSVRDEFERSSDISVAIPVANPTKAVLQFPPTGVAYRDHAESFVVWNWIQLHAPDNVDITSESGEAQRATSIQLASALTHDVPGFPAGDPTSLVTLRLTLPSDDIKRRLARTPQQVANQLADVYGHDFNQLTYLPGMALLGQIRLGRRTDVAALAAPYLTPGRDLLKNASSLTLAGHLVFAELARRTGDKRYTDLVRKAADLGFTATGQMQESMPFHGEMSDSYFMAGPITAMAGKLTGDRKYFDMVVRHFKFMDSLVLRDDGLYRHSPLTNAAWGRGNSFPALGMALALSEFPETHPGRPYLLEAYRTLMNRLIRFQDPDGMWHEIIDNPASYQELSCTMMFGTAMKRGIARGWLDPAAFQPLVDKAWRASVIRISEKGDLIDVAESTNKQPAYDDYLNRAALSGKDERGGGMALFFATEMAGLP